jgi:hypothetical protein
LCIGPAAIEPALGALGLWQQLIDLIRSYQGVKRPAAGR